MAKRQSITIGSVLEISTEGYYYYAQILGKSGYVFFDFRSQKQLKNIEDLNNSSILFIISVYDDVVTKKRWLKMGKIPIRVELETQPFQFIQDSLNLNNFDLYNPNTGEIIPATRDDCKELECAAVWEAEHVEERLRDHYANKSNRWVDQLAIK